MVLSFKKLVVIENVENGHKFRVSKVDIVGWSIKVNFRRLLTRVEVHCGDGSEVRVPKRCFGELRLFKNPSVVATGSYTLKCKASPQIMNLLLMTANGGSEERFLLV